MTKKQNKFSLFILMLCVGVTYYTVWPLVLMHQYYYDAMVQVFGLSHSQMGTYGLVSGICSVLAYMISGLYGDKFDTKKLLCTSLVILGVGQLFMSTIPPFGVLVVVNIFLNLVGIGTFWGAFAKYVKLLGDGDEKAENKIYGNQYAFVGIGGAVLGTIEAGIVGNAAEVINGMRTMLVINGVINLVTLIAVILFFKPTFSLIGTGEDRFRVKYIAEILKMPVFWFMALTLMAIYGTSVATSYMSPLLYNLGIPLTIVSAIGSFKYFAMRLIFAPVGGMILSKSKYSIRTLSILLVFTTIIILIAGLGGINSAAVILLAVIGCSIVYQISTPAWFTTLSEARIPKKYLGTAIGLFTGILQLPDAYGYTMAEKIIEHTSETTGYQIVFLFWAAMGAVGIVSGLIATKMVKRIQSNEDFAEVHDSEK